jgi:hypothetical protein
MKKFLIVLLLALATVGFVSAVDINTADDLGISATLQNKYVVSVVTETPIVLEVAGAGPVSVGTVNLYTNKKAWKLSITSTNEGKLKAVDGATTYLIPYSFDLDGSIYGTAKTFFGVAATGYSGWGATAVVDTFSGRTTPSTGDTLTARIYYQAENGQWVADLTYTDTVHLVMAAQ